MSTLILAIIYLAFISLGLPDSLLGSAWPIMQKQMEIPMSYAGIISTIIAGGTIISSLLSDRMTKKFGTGPVTASSVFLTASALFGFSMSSSFWQLCLWAIPCGLGAGAVDAALNNYVALHYASRHMNWLHCFWGVGAAAGPYIMSYALTNANGWNSGYRTVAIIQITLTAGLFATLFLWKNQNIPSGQEHTKAPALKLPQILQIKGVKYILPAFFAYCALETTTGLWASSFLVLQKNITPETAAKYSALFFIGITAGRFLCGFIANKIGDKNMIRAGLTILLIGILMVWLPLSFNWLCLNGLIIIGLGCAPVYPAIIHATPTNFGKENSQAIVGLQMASAYTGSTLMPPLFGCLATQITTALFPPFLFLLAVLILFMNEKLNKTLSTK